MTAEVPSRSRSLNKTAAKSMVQIGVVADIGDTRTTGPEEKAASIEKMPSVSQIPPIINGQSAFLCQSGFSLLAGEAR